MDELANLVLDEFRNNGLYTATKDKNGNWNVSKTKLSFEKYEQLKEIFKGLNKNGRTSTEQKVTDDKAIKDVQNGTEVKNGSIMKRINILILSFALFFASCSNHNDFDNIIANEFEECTEQNNNCIVDFSKIMKFEWDTMYYFSGANSLEDINKNLGFELKEFTDIGDRIIFLNDGKIVYQKEWFPNPSKELKGVVFATDLETFKIDKSNATFKITKQGKAFFLEKL